MDPVIRCPMCVEAAKELVRGQNRWGIEAADRLIAQATFADWIDRARHLVLVHNWTPQPQLMEPTHEQGSVDTVLRGSTGGSGGTGTEAPGGMGSGASDRA